MAAPAGARLARALEDGVAGATPDSTEDTVHGIDLSDAGAVPPGMCCECRDQPHTLSCPSCSGDLFCAVCFVSIHRGGSRRGHKPSEALSPLLEALEGAKAKAPVAAPATGPQAAEGEATTTAGKRTSADAPHLDDGVDEDDAAAEDAAASNVVAETVSFNWEAMARVTPLRLTFEERRLLRLIEAALHVSEYTDKVDIAGLGWSKGKRIHEQLKALFSVICGLLVAEDFEAGKRALADSELETHQQLFRNAFELARRYKVLNPDRMRDYGKLLHLLQDSRIPEVRELLGFDCVRPLRTVFTLLEAKGDRALALLKVRVRAVCVCEGGARLPRPSPLSLDHAPSPRAAPPRRRRTRPCWSLRRASSSPTGAPATSSTSTSGGRRRPRRS